MSRIIYFTITQISTRESVKLDCKIEQYGVLICPVLYSVNKNELSRMVKQSDSAFVNTLMKEGTCVQEIDGQGKLFSEAILIKLRKEFGNKFIIIPIDQDVKLDRNRSNTEWQARGNSGPKIEFKDITFDTTNADVKLSINDGPIIKPKLTEEAPAKIINYTVAGTKKNTDFDTVQVLFATDRNKTTSAEPNLKFDNTRNTSNSLEYGVCKVSIPSDHRIGFIERPTWFSDLLFKNPENPHKHVTLYDLELKTEKKFLEAISSKINSSTNNDAFIFIHGFNVDFPEAIRRTAQIAYDLSFKGAAITYSWPSKGTAQGYLADEDSVVWTVPHLKQLIKKVLSDTSLNKLHLIAHSMGNRALTSAIKELKEEGVNLSAINQIILAAPDIDSAIFTDVIVPAIKGVSKQITLYASSKDKALQLSHSLRGMIRAGESGEHIIIVNGISTVDVSKIDTDFLGHGYFAETKELINDMYLLLEYSYAPQQRNLREGPESYKGLYWLFPY